MIYFSKMYIFHSKDTAFEDISANTPSQLSVVLNALLYFILNAINANQQYILVIDAKSVFGKCLQLVKVVTLTF